MKKGLVAFITALTLVSAQMPFIQADSVWQPNIIRVAENLDRGLVAMQANNGVYLTWRLQADEDNVYGTGTANVSFDIYRDGTKIATESKTTNYFDADGTAESKYQVVISGGNASDCEEVTAFTSGSNYFDIALDKPDDLTINGTVYSYTANDVSCGDLDGDGEYELVLKWDCHGQDNSSGGSGDYTGNVYLDAYKMNGTKLWRVDLGPNIRAGAHYTQFLVYDFDADGKAEVTAKTAPGSKGGDGNYVSKTSHVDAIKNITDEINETLYRDGGGMVVTGDEYLSIFNGDTGVAEDTIYYPNQRIVQDVWGDDWGNRVDRFNAAVAYLDGEKPYAVYMRGYYFGSNGQQRQAACGVSFDGTKLECKYSFDTYNPDSYASKSTSSSYDSGGNYKGVNGYVSGNEKYVGQGNHNVTVADVDNDGKEEVLTGALCYELKNEILTPLWCTYRSHGDAMHIGEYDPTHSGYEYFVVHEDSPYGMSVIDAANGSMLYHEDAGGDTGRGMMADVGAGYYYQFWSSGNGPQFGVGQTEMQPTSIANFTYNFRIFWDGDLYDELLDGSTANTTSGERLGTVSIYDWNGVMMKGIFSAGSECAPINNTKNNPNLQADLFGDWREEIVCRHKDSNALRVFTTNIETEYKMKSLMYDAVYRAGVAAEQSAYNQPPHIGYYLKQKETYIPENAPNVTVPAGATTILSQDLDGNGTDTVKYDTMSDYKSEEYTGISGLTFTNGGGNKKGSTKFVGITNTGDNNRAIVLGAGQYASAGRGITLTFSDNLSTYNVSSTLTGGVTFALKLFDNDNHKGSLYFLKDTATINASDYANKIATVNTDDIGHDEWAVVRYEFTDTKYSLYINDELKSSGSCDMASIPVIGMNTSSSSTNPNTGMIMDNISTYTFSVTTTATPEAQIFKAEADTYLVHDDATVAHGADTELKINSASNVYTSSVPGLKEPKGLGLIRFNISESADKEIKSAILKLNMKYSGSVGSQLNLDYCSKDDWDEATLTSNDIIIRGKGTPLSYLGLNTYPTVTSSYQEIEFDVTNAIKADTDNVHTFTLWTSTAREQIVASREYSGDDATGPQLVITYVKSTPTATPTAKPTATPTAKPTATPTAKPTATPTAKPTATPTAKPTAKPTATPTAKPTATPTATPMVTEEPAVSPTSDPTVCEWVEYDAAENRAMIKSIASREKATVIFASYDGNGMLVSISLQVDVPVAVGENYITPTDNFSKTDNVKVFVWDGLENMKPMFYMK